MSCRQLSPLVAFALFVSFVVLLPQPVSAATVNAIVVLTDRTDYINVPGFNNVIATATLDFNGNFAQMDPVRFEWFDPGALVPFRSVYIRTVQVGAQTAEAQDTWVATREGLGFTVNASINQTVNMPPVLASVASFNVSNRSAAVLVTGISVAVDPVYEVGMVASARADVTYVGNPVYLGDVRFEWYHPDWTLAFTELYPSPTQAVAWSNWTTDRVGSAFHVNATYTDADPWSDSAAFDVVPTRVDTWLSSDFNTGGRVSLPPGFYGICANLTVAAGTELYIPAGVVIRFCLDTALTVDGTLTVAGLETERVLFLSYELQNGSGDWRGIIFRPTASSSSVVSHAIVDAVTTGISVTGVGITILNTTVTRASDAAIRLVGSSSVIGNSILRSAGIGVHIRGSIDAVVDGTVITRTRLGVFVENSTVHLAANVIAQADDVGLQAVRSSVRVEGGSFLNNQDIGIFLSGSPSAHLGGVSILGGNDSIRAENSRGVVVEASTLASAGIRGLFFINVTATVTNTTLAAQDYDLVLVASRVTLVNSTYARLYPLVSSILEVQNFLHILVESNISPRPRIAGAWVNVTSDGVPVASRRTNPVGWTQWVLLTDRIHDSGGVRKILNVVDVSVPGFDVLQDPRTVDMATSHPETFAVIPATAPRLTLGVDALLLLLVAVALVTVLVAMPIVRRRKDGGAARARPPPHVIALEPGTSYVLPDKKPDRAFEIFASQVAHGAKGIAVTRIYPDEVRRRYRLLDLPILWLSRGYGKETVNPTNLGALLQDVERFVSGKENGIVLLDGLEYLLVQNDPAKVMKFIQNLVDMASVHRTKVLIPFDTSSVDEAVRARLLRDLETL